MYKKFNDLNIINIIRIISGVQYQYNIIKY